MPISADVSQNLLLAGAYWLFYGLYFPFNFWQNRRPVDRCLAIHWDRRMPYSELFYVPYILGLAITVLGPWVLAFFATPTQFAWLIMALTIVLAISYLVWIFYPCRVIKTSKIHNKKHSWIVRSLLGYGQKFGDYNSFPSAHVSLVTTMSLWLMIVFPQFILVWLLLLVINFSSVLLTHQHYVADALAGLGLAGLVFYVSAFIR